MGLTGEIKKVPSLEVRLRELDRMGYRLAYIPPNSAKGVKVEKIKLVEKNSLIDVIRDIF